MRALKITESITTRESESFMRYLKEVSSIELFKTVDDETECGVKAYNGCKASVDELIKRNLRFVISVAKQYTKGDVLLEDLVNEGNVGLIYSANTFDPTKGNKFISYAVWHIRKEILKYLYTTDRLVRIPNNKLTGLSAMNRVVTQLEQKLGRTVTINDILYSDVNEELLEGKYTKEDIVSLMEVSNSSPQSFDTPTTDEGSSIQDVMVGDVFGPSDQSIISDDENFIFNELINATGKLNSKILRMFFGIGYLTPMSLADIGKEVGLSGERVRQIKESSLNHLNELVKKYEINDLNLS